MPGEEEVRQCAIEVLQSMGLTQWEVSTHKRNAEEGEEGLPFSIKIVTTEQQNFSSRPPFIEVTLIGESPEGNITDVSFNYGFTIEYPGSFSVNSALNQDVWDRHGESAMRGASWMIQQLNPEAQMNTQTSRAYEFMSKLIQILSTQSHPEI